MKASTGFWSISSKNSDRFEVSVLLQITLNYIECLVLIGLYSCTVWLIYAVVWCLSSHLSVFYKPVLYHIMAKHIARHFVAACALTFDQYPVGSSARGSPNCRENVQLSKNKLVMSWKRCKWKVDRMCGTRQWQWQCERRCWLPSTVDNCKSCFWIFLLVSVTSEAICI